MKVINHIMYTMSQKPLSFFIPEWARKGQRAQGKDIKNIKVIAVDEMGIIRAAT